ncbi:TPA: lytic murein transglycosylase [Mannheimia haemolytica]
MDFSRILAFVAIFFSGISLSLAKPFNGFGSEIDNYIRIAAQRYQVSEEMLRGIVKIEDGWYGKISPTGATGVGQFTVGTWNWLSETDRGKQIGMRLITAQNRSSYADPRRDKYTNTLATALLARWHIEQFQARNIPVTDENVYMAHNIGLDGLHRAMEGKATKEDMLNMRRNGMKSWMTVRDFLNYQKGRFLAHKQEANFMMVSKQSHIHTGVSAFVYPTSEMGKSVKWVEPENNKMIWVEPKNAMIWVEPQNNL